MRKEMKTSGNGRTRFQRDPLNMDVQLAKLREEAPGLGGNKKLRIYALLGSALTLLTVTGLYYTINIYKAIAEDRNSMNRVEVDIASEIVFSEPTKVLHKLEADEAAAEDVYAQQLEALKSVDLLKEMDNASAKSQPSRGEKQPGL